MDKKQAVKVISEAVKIYDNIHCNKNLLIIFGSPNKPSYIETKAGVKNFFHLTGVKLNDSLLNDMANKNTNILDVFYSKAMQNKLSIENFDFKDSSTVQKLQVLANTLKISTNVKMIGDYLDVRINLKTDKIAGSVNSFLGFVKSGKYYTPNTVMADDLRKNTIKPKKVLAILSKNVDDDKYNTIKMVGKKIDIKRLLEKVSPLVDIDSKFMDEIESRSSQSRPQQQNDNIKQIKFDNPTPQNILHNNSGVAAAVLPAPNPFKSFWGKISSLKNLFKKQDKLVETPVTVEAAEKTAISETGAAVEKTPVSKELAILNEARKSLANGNISKNEYLKVLVFYIKTLGSEEKAEKAIETLNNLRDELPPNEKRFIKGEIYNIQHYLQEKYRPDKKSYLETLKTITAPKNPKTQDDLTEEKNHSVRNNNER